MVEAQEFAKFEARGEAVRASITTEYTNKGAEEEQKIRREFELRGEVEMKSIELELRKRGEVEAREIMAEFVRRGAELEMTIRKEFEERGEVVMEEIRKELEDRGRKLQIEGEDACTDMITMACEVVMMVIKLKMKFKFQDVIEGSESGDYCEEFLFFTDSLDRKRRKIRTLHKHLTKEPKTYKQP